MATPTPPNRGGVTFQERSVVVNDASYGEEERYYQSPRSRTSGCGGSARGGGREERKQTWLVG